MQRESLGRFQAEMWSFPGGAVVKNLPVNIGDARDSGLKPGSVRSPGEGKWQPTPVFLPGKFLEQRSLVGYSLCGCKELDVPEWLSM